MSRRRLRFLMALVMTAAMIVAPMGSKVQAAQENAVLPGACPCGCGVAIQELQWKVWDPNEASLVISGHYYLDGNYAQAEQYNISEGEKYVLDLRGYELSTSDYCRLFLCNGYLAVLDSVGGGKMCSKTSGGGFGGVLFMQTSGATFELYGGTVTVDEDNKGSRRGGLICLNGGCTFNMYGGTLVGGSSQGTKDEEGGCVATYFSTGAINILGGSVIGGYSPTHGGNIYSKGTTVLKNCTITGGVADGYGGNIYQSGGSLTMENCVISHGVSNGTAATVTGGGNVCAVSSAGVNMKDSKIHNGYAASYGGNLYLGSGTELLENVTVTAGVCGEAGGNIRVAANAKPTMIDCTIDGDVSCNGTLTLAGKTKIGLRNYGLKLGANPVTATELTDGAEIFVAGEGTITGANAAAANNASIVLRFDYRDHASLFTGDLYVEREADLMELHGALLDVDLLKAPHHGNGITSNSEEFLAAVSPQIAVATGFENIQSRIAQRFTDVGATLLNDRTYGYVHITTDGIDEMTYETSRQEALG